MEVEFVHLHYHRMINGVSLCLWRPHTHTHTHTDRDTEKTKNDKMFETRLSSWIITSQDCKGSLQDELRVRQRNTEGGREGGRERERERGREG